MNVAIVSESPADEVAVRVLVEAVLEQPVEFVAAPSARPGGIDGALAIIEPTLKWLHYRRRADGLVLVVDAHDSPLHAGEPHLACEAADTCRLCRIRRRIELCRDSLASLPSYGPIPTAVGLAVPAVEAWYLCGKEQNVSENAWVQRRAPYTKERLKELVYGTDRPSLALETECAKREMRRVVADLALLEREFPVGFGALAADLGSWPNA